MKKVLIFAGATILIFCFCNTYISETVSPLIALVGIICQTACFIGHMQERRFERLKRNYADSVEFYGDKMRFVMEDKEVVNTSKNEIYKIVEHKSDMGYHFYLKNGMTIYYDFGKNMFTKKDIRNIVKHANFPNTKFETAV